LETGGAGHLKADDLPVSQPADHVKALTGKDA